VIALYVYHIVQSLKLFDQKLYPYLKNNNRLRTSNKSNDVGSKMIKKKSHVSLASLEKPNTRDSKEVWGDGGKI